MCSNICALDNNRRNLAGALPPIGLLYVITRFIMNGIVSSNAAKECIATFPPNEWPSRMIDGVRTVIVTKSANSRPTIEGFVFQLYPNDAH
jgi:hypothetical protein